MVKPKIALCLSGQLRCHYKLVEHWVHNVILPLSHNYDVVLFFYLGQDHYYTDTWDNILNQYKVYDIEVIHQTEIDKDFINIVPKIFELTPSGLSQGHNQLIREHYFMDQVIKLKRKYEEEHNLYFQYVIRSRPDCLPGIFHLSLLDLVENNFCISDHDHHNYINGRFTICTSKTADEIFSLLDHYNQTIEHLPPISGNDFNSNLKYFAGEYFWKTHLSLFNINIELIPYAVYLVRDYDPFFHHSHQGKIFLDGREFARFENGTSIPINIVK